MFAAQRINTLSKLVLTTASLKKESEEDGRQLLNFLGKLFDYNPETRATALEVFEDPFLSIETSERNSLKRKRSFEGDDQGEASLKRF